MVPIQLYRLPLTTLCDPFYSCNVLFCRYSHIDVTERQGAHACNAHNAITGRGAPGHAGRCEAFACDLRTPSAHTICAHHLRHVL